MTKNQLKGRNIAVLAADGFEKIELAVPLKALKSAGAAVDIISLRKGKIRAMDLHEPAGEVRVQKSLSEALPESYDALFIPGGFINPDLLRQSAEAREFVKAFDEQKKPIASICHGPWVLASSGILTGRTLTSWPGIRDDLVNAGAIWLDKEVVRDGNFLTSRSPEDIHAFTQALKDFFSAEPSTAVSEGAYSSAAQPKEPPRGVLSAMKWLPKFSLKALGVAAVTLGVGAIGIRQKR